MTEKMDLTRSQRFDAAADFLEKHGLWKGSFHENFGEDLDVLPPAPSCALGALAWGGYGTAFCNLSDKDEETIWHHDLPVLEKYVPVSGMSAPSFNDRRETTADDVVDLFRRAAKFEAEKESE